MISDTSSTVTPFKPGSERIRQATATLGSLPWWVWMVTVIAMGWGALTSNPIITPFAIGLLPVIAILLWRPGEPPVLVFACWMQWLQAAAAIFYTNSYRLTLEQAYGGPALEQAIWLSLLGVITLAVGVRIALVSAPPFMRRDMIAAVEKVSISKVFIAYLISFVFTGAVAAVAFRVPGLTQVLFAIVSLKWFILFVLAYCVIERRRENGLLVVAVGLEFSTGLLTYFASFKSIFFLLFIVALTSRRALQRGRRLALTVFVTMLLFVCGVVWTAIKNDYREFLNKGSGQQEILVSVNERVDKLQELVATFSWQRFTEGLESLVLRVSYVNYFAQALMHVPEAMPHENGALWLGTITHVLMPRLLFPDKEALDDSARTTLYTGMTVAGAEEGTSIGLGYVAESYIDFGPPWMFAPILLLGLLYGFVYRYFIAGARFRLLGFAAGTALLLPCIDNFETSNVKIVGGFIMALLVMLFAFNLARRRFPDLV